MTRLNTYAKIKRLWQNQTPMTRSWLYSCCEYASVTNLQPSCHNIPTLYRQGYRVSSTNVIHIIIGCIQSDTGYLDFSVSRSTKGYELRYETLLIVPWLNFLTSSSGLSNLCTTVKHASSRQWIPDSYTERPAKYLIQNRQAKDW